MILGGILRREEVGTVNLSQVPHRIDEGKADAPNLIACVTEIA